MYRNLYKNILGLSGLQAINFFLTLAVLPYLARVMGASSWGKVVFVQMVVNYVCWTVNWGFYLGATKTVAECRENKPVRSAVFCSVWFAQWALTAMALIIFLGLIVEIDFFNANASLYLAASGLIIGNTLTPLWFLNGLEMVKESAFVQIVAKLVALPAIFIFVEGDGSAGNYLLINSLSSIVVGLFVSAWLIKSKYLDFVLPPIGDVYSAIKRDSGLFVSSMLANLNASIVPGMLGIYGGDAQLGYYNLADRAKGAAITVLHPIAHALFPRMCYLFGNDRQEAVRLLKKSGLILISLSIVSGLLIFMFAPLVIKILGGGDFIEAIKPLQYFSLMPAICTASAFIVYQIVIPSGHYSAYSKMVALCMIAASLIILMLGFRLDATTAAIISLVVESIGLAYLLVVCKKMKLISLG